MWKYIELVYKDIPINTIISKIYHLKNIFLVRLIKKHIFALNNSNKPF